jgi:hypothetical protein
MRMMKIRTGVAALATGVALVAGAATAAQAAPSPSAHQAARSGHNSRPAPLSAMGLWQSAHPDATVEGCKSGYVCLYPGESWNGGHPSESWLTYGNHNLDNVLGHHYLEDNQTGGAWDLECKGYNGTGTTIAWGQSVSGADIYFTPINSVRLEPTESFCSGGLAGGR